MASLRFEQSHKLMYAAIRWLAMRINKGITALADLQAVSKIDRCTVSIPPLTFSRSFVAMSRKSSDSTRLESSLAKTPMRLSSTACLSLTCRPRKKQSLALELTDSHLSVQERRPWVRVSSNSWMKFTDQPSLTASSSLNHHLPSPFEASSPCKASQGA